MDHAPMQNNDAPEKTGEQVPVRRKKRYTLRGRRAGIASAVAAAAVLLVMLSVGRLDILAQNFLDRLRDTAPETTGPEVTPAEASSPQSPPLMFSEMDIHPDVVFRPYTAGPVLAEGKGDMQTRMIEQFRDLLALYTQRQGIDDNFTIRVTDNRTGDVLEVYELESQRANFEQTGEANWGAIDGLRRQETNRLVKKWASNGIPQPAISVKWGRANQIREARERNAPFIEHEVRLARMLGLSLLATQIPTVETFNQDRLISSVGARSRYQMMPYILRQNGIRHYNLRSASGNVVQVFEEWHPLLTMEPAFVTLKGYINSVGHEIPGISAYHTGPGNIYMVFRTYLDQLDALDESVTVADAYLWAVTEGFDEVSSGTSFKTYSRGYVPSNYGALKATEDVPIDTTETFLAERVQLRDGEQIFLSDLIELLESDPQFMSANRQLVEAREGPRHLYNQIRELNPHIQLPAFQGEAVPPAGDVRFVASVDGADVRFFLPVGAMDALERAGQDIIDPGNSLVLDRNAYGSPNPSQVTTYDRQYDELIDSIRQFGFTNANRVQLLRLRSRFAELAEENPTLYRRLQLAVIRTHAQIWQSGPWDRLETAVSSKRGSARVTAQAAATTVAPSR